MSRGIVFDTEVNSLDSKECIELAFVEVDVYEGQLVQHAAIQTSFFKPEQPFEAGAIAVHYILPTDVENSPPSADAKIPEAEFIIAHNVDFDCEVLKIDGPNRICTLALSRHLWPEFKSHTLSAMIIELQGANAETIGQIKNAHAADADVSLKLTLLRKILEKTGVKTLDELYRLSEVARVPTVWAFGKHKGTRIDETPRDYIQWMMRQSDVDKYLLKALKAAL